MDKLDLKKLHAALYKATARPMVVKVPKLRYLAMDGTGDPNNNPAFEQAVQALYSLSYTLKFMCKNGPQQVDWGVMPLEGVWWADDMHDFIRQDRTKWRWTLMMLQPELVDTKLLKAAQAELIRRKKDLPRLQDARLRTMNEGACAQVLHFGPYANEGPAIAKLHAFIQEQGRVLRGRHREIYLSDPRRVPQAKWRTILRQPMG